MKQDLTQPLLINGKESTFGTFGNNSVLNDNRLSAQQLSEMQTELIRTTANLVSGFDKVRSKVVSTQVGCLAAFFTCGFFSSWSLANLAKNAIAELATDQKEFAAAVKLYVSSRDKLDAKTIAFVEQEITRFKKETTEFEQEIDRALNLYRETNNYHDVAIQPTTEKIIESCDQALVTVSPAASQALG